MTSTGQFRIGLLRLTDAAPLIAARELGFFASEDIEVRFSVEPSWANVADKLAFGLLDGAMLLPPLALALGLGLSGGGPEAIVVPMALSLNGNTVTLAPRWADEIRAAGGDDGRDAMTTARRFGGLIRARAEKPVLAVVHTFSTHNLLLRYWLAAGGIDPASEAAFTVVPPAETADALAAAKIDGFCVGAPWGRSRRAPGAGALSPHRARSGATASKRCSRCADGLPKTTHPGCDACCARCCAPRLIAVSRRTRPGWRGSSPSRVISACRRV
jgi:two-component system, oxyanion-binding sensor